MSTIQVLGIPVLWIFPFQKPWFLSPNFSAKMRLSFVFFSPLFFFFFYQRHPRASTAVIVFCIEAARKEDTPCWLHVPSFNSPSKDTCSASISSAFRQLFLRVDGSYVWEDWFIRNLFCYAGCRILVYMS